MNRFACLLVVGPLVLGVGCGGRLSGTDSTTQFWRSCDSDTECGGLACICGHCTEVCTLHGECARYGGGATCGDFESQCDDARGAQVCSPTAEQGSVNVQPGPVGASDPSTPAANGATGQTGASGPVGASGNAGDTSTVGLSGATGNIGATGAFGASGSTGASGGTGAFGASGGTGATGSTGAFGGSGGLSGASGATAIGCGIAGGADEVSRFAIGETSPWRSVAAAIADLNDDGFEDLVTSDSFTSLIHVLFGNGNGAFANKTAYETDTGPSSLAVCDLNDDDVSDVVTANSEAGTVSVLLGLNGELGPRVDYPAGLSPHSVVIGDLNSDGAQDVAVLNSSTVGGFSILRGVGDGSLEAPIQYFDSAGGQGVAWTSLQLGDLNSDGRLDVVFADRYVRALLGSDSELFVEMVPLEAAFYLTTDLTLGDFDGDEKLDLGLADPGGRGPTPALNVLPGLGDGNFSLPGSYPAEYGGSFNQIEAVNINRDERADLVGCGSNLSVFLSNADGRVTQSCEALISCDAFAIGDLNDDANNDVVLVSPSVNTYGAAVLLGNGDGTFSLGAADASTGR